MPRKTKEASNNEISKITTAIKEVLSKKLSLEKKDSSKSNTTKKASTTKPATTKKTSKAKTPSSNKKTASTKKTTTTAETTATKKAATTKKVTTTKTASTTKKAATNKKTTTVKKVPTAKTTTSKKDTTVKTKTTKPKRASTSKISNTIKSSTEKKATTKKASTSKAVATKKTSTTKAATSKKTSKSKKDIAVIDKKFSAEYYDLPFRYNQTVVKILAQTPKNLFVYWEISDEDRENLKKQYGKYFFEITKPVLIVYNETMNYTFEVDIDDFANSWYLHVNDSNSEYKIELGRRPIPVNYNYIPDYDIQKNGPIEEIKIPYIYISSSNDLDAPNDKILFNRLDKIYFRNVKTNEIIEKDISDFPNIYRDGKFINIYKLYHELYKEEIKNDSFNLYNPSSGNVSSGSFSSRFY